MMELYINSPFPKGYKVHVDFIYQWYHVSLFSSSCSYRKAYYFTTSISIQCYLPSLEQCDFVDFWIVFRLQELLKLSKRVQASSIAVARLRLLTRRASEPRNVSVQYVTMSLIQANLFHSPRNARTSHIHVQVVFSKLQ